MKNWSSQIFIHHRPFEQVSSGAGWQCDGFIGRFGSVVSRNEIALKNYDESGCGVSLASYKKMKAIYRSWVWRSRRKVMNGERERQKNQIKWKCEVTERDMMMKSESREEREILNKVRWVETEIEIHSWIVRQHDFINVQRIDRIDVLYLCAVGCSLGQWANIEWGLYTPSLYFGQIRLHLGYIFGNCTRPFRTIKNHFFTFKTRHPHLTRPWQHMGLGFIRLRAG